MKGSIMTNQALTNQSKPSSEKEPTNIQRRTLIGGALVALLSSPERVVAQGKALDRRREDHSEPKDPLVLLLNGPYHPVVAGTGPDLHLQGAGVDLNDGSYSVTQIFPVHVEGIPCRANEDTPIGKFYVQFAGSLCAYEIPGGALAMQFTPNCGGFKPDVPDGLGGAYMNGTFELTVLEATGKFRPFEGGHNHMVDRLHRLANGTFDEYCFCFISRA
jgi:hypothetical protein